MFITGIWFVGSMVGIILVARFALYIPARKLAHAGGLSQSATGQLLGYLTSAPELVATVFVASTGLFTVVSSLDIRIYGCRSNKQQQTNN